MKGLCIFTTNQNERGTFMSCIKQIMEDDWYRTATPQEMRVALMHLEMSAMQRLNNSLTEHYKEVREECFESCADDNRWNEKTQESEQ